MVFSTCFGCEMICGVDSAPALKVFQSPIGAPSMSNRHWGTGSKAVGLFLFSLSLCLRQTSVRDVKFKITARRERVDVFWRHTHVEDEIMWFPKWHQHLLLLRNELIRESSLAGGGKGCNVVSKRGIGFLWICGCSHWRSNTFCVKPGGNRKIWIRQKYTQRRKKRCPPF